jgi:hypothetical protein
MTLLAKRFEGIGDPAQLNVEKTAAGLMVYHAGYKFRWHAFGGTATPEQIHAREVKRLPYLARKLMEEIETASRIFVRKPDLHSLDGEAEAINILRLMETYGGHPMLMFVEDGATQTGVDWISPHLLRGRIAAFADQSAVPSTTRSEDWLAICRIAMPA